MLNFSNGSWGGAYSDYENIRFHILVNDTWGYMPQLFYSAVNDHCVLRNITVDVLERRLGTGEPTTYSVSQYMIRSHGSREFLIENISVNLPKCWRITEYGRVVSLSGFATAVSPVTVSPSKMSQSIWQNPTGLTANIMATITTGSNMARQNRGSTLVFLLLR